MDAFRNVAKGLKGRALPGPHDYEQIPELAERGRSRVEHFFRDMDRTPRGPRLRGGQPLHHRGYLRDGADRLRGLGQAESSGRLRQFAPLVRVRLGAPEREGIKHARYLQAVHPMAQENR